MAVGTELLTRIWNEEYGWGDKRHPIRDNHPQIMLSIKWQLERELLKSPGSILDVCGGNTTHLYIPEPLLANTTVLDGNIDFLGQSRAAYTQPGDTHDAFPFPDSVFDTVVSFFGMRYSPIIPVINEMKRVVKPNGKILLFDFDTIGHPLEEAVFSPDKLRSKVGVGLSQFEFVSVAEQNKHHSAVWLFKGLKAS